MAEAAAVLDTRAGTRKIELAAVAMTLLLGLVAFAVLAPLLMMLISSVQLSAPGRVPVYGLDGWVKVLTDPSIATAFRNSILLSVVREAIALVVGVMLAWLIARTDLPGRGAFEFIFWIAFFLPPLPVALGWILLLDGKVGLVNQWIAALPFGVESLFNIYSFWGIV